MQQKRVVYYNKKNGLEHFRRDGPYKYTKNFISLKTVNLS